MYQRKWKEPDADWVPITDEDALMFARRNYTYPESALCSVRDGFDMNTPFAWVRWVDDDVEVTHDRQEE